MRNFDLSPLYRSAIGFDRLFNALEAGQSQGNGGYPPYNVELVDENHYRIAIAVAGFAEQELEITTQDNLLIVRGAIIMNLLKEPTYIKVLPSVTSSVNFSWPSISKLKARSWRMGCCISIWSASCRKH
ncbi:16 kDa heat shock protein A [Serratia plymuthica]|nr:16 kDa heat shock protein A [Serratia plymuthica]